MDEKEDKGLIDFVNAELEKELGAPVFSEPPRVPENKADNLQGEGTRKNYRLHDFDTPHDKEMAVFTHAKKFSEYIFVITRKSPVRLRWSIISRLQNITVDIIENLYRANYSDNSEEREEYQKRAMTNLSIADHYTVTAKTMQAINFHQLTVISRQIYELKRLIAGWIRSDKKRSKE